MFTAYDSETGWKRIYGGKELAKQVTDTIDYYERHNKQLQETNNELIKNAQEVVKHQYEEEIKSLKHSLSLSYGSFTTEKERNAYEDFVERHIHDRETSRAHGGLAPYIIPDYTGIGCIKKVVCQICGESEDITDMEAW